VRCRRGGCRVTMIEPELFSFHPPLNKHTYVKKCWDKLLVDVGEYGLTHSITVVLPDTLFVPDYIGNVFSENDQYYMVKSVTLSSLIDPGFVTSFVKNGKVYAVSLNTHFEIEDRITITNNNLLQMSLIPSSCQNICLPAKDSRITLDLKELKFNSKYYQRIKECFQRFKEKFNLLVCWEPNDDDVCSSSIASYFDKNGFVCHECNPRLAKKTKYNVTIPTDNNVALLDNWLSYFCLDIDLDDKAHSVLLDEKLTKLNSHDVGQVTQLVWTGFFNNDKVKRLLEKFREFIEKQGRSYWLSVHLEPFSNSLYACTHKTILLNLDDNHFVSRCIKCKKS